MKTTYLGKFKRGRKHQTTIPVNPHVHQQFNATTILNILNVIIMMRMTCASLCKFYGKVDMIRYEALVAMAEGKRGATAAKQKCYHGNISGDPATQMRCQCKGTSVGARNVQE